MIYSDTQTRTRTFLTQPITNDKNHSGETSFNIKIYVCHLLRAENQGSKPSALQKKPRRQHYFLCSVEVRSLKGAVLKFQFDKTK